MANMSYCRCENTYKDLLEVWQEVEVDDLSESEKRYFGKLVKLCAKIADNYGEED